MIRNVISRSATPWWAGLRSASCFYVTPVNYLYLDRSQKWLDAHRVEQKKQMATEQKKQMATE